MELYAEAEEKTYIGAVMQTPELLEMHTVQVEWFTPNHQRIMQAIWDLKESESDINPMAVLEQMQLTDATLGGQKVAVYLFELFQMSDLGTATFCARKIAEAAQRRSLIEHAARISQKLQSPDFSEALDFTAKEILNMQLALDDPLDEGPIEGLSSLEEFLARPLATSDWVIPGVLKRQERVIFLAPPGVGKSTLARQSAILLAAGKHPFWPDLNIPSQKTLLVDLENPPDIVASKTRPEMEKISEEERRNVFLYHQPGGIDVRTAKGARLLERVVAQIRPSVMFVGPLYKMAFKGRDDWETVALETSQVLDRIRTKYDCALWIEHHMPKASMGSMNKTPFGSSLWERWPEFGFILSQKENGSNEYVMEPYRPGRDERTWPLGLWRGGPWPWQGLFNQKDDREFHEAVRSQNASWEKI